MRPSSSRLGRYLLTVDTESGIIVFHVISGKLAKKTRVEVLLDDGYWPCFSTVKARSTNAQWGYVGEGFMKEVDFGRVWLRLNEAHEGESDDVIAEWQGEAKAFLQATFVGLHFCFLTNFEVCKLTLSALEWATNIYFENRRW